ncbi:hypothetical protein ZOSMA_40G00600 [Zostera marina]|uniref:Uncharacterized protein n=1 Tax=Zostera marina TaxID=29655 RepID=A0A0K9P360_ZOSMR|nr:hypothetical protein ZOSMA_40G00600 [Zostera marina]
MNFSNDWRNVWPITGVIAAPSLITGSESSSSDVSTNLGPLLFSPATPPINLLSSASLYVPITLPDFPTITRGNLSAFFTGGISDAFFPQALQYKLLSSILSESDYNDPFLSNHISVLKCRDVDSYVFFFPTGKNSDKIGFFGITMIDGQPNLIGNVDGDVFEQRDGYKHEFQKIKKISVRGLDPFDPEPEDSIVEGYLLACTMFTVIWFRVEIRFIDTKRLKKKPVLIPLSKQGFKSSVVCACWNPNFVEECVVLLESGELIWINIDNKKGKTIPLLHNATATSTGGCKWLAADFGVHPWSVLVAESESILMVDLRNANCKKPPTVVAKVKDPGAPFIVFSIAEFDRYYFSVATNCQLFLFDTREILYPLLVWDHDIRDPSSISMFRLSDLRSVSEEFWRATESGYAIMVGSIWNSKFKLFFYGPDLRVKSRSEFCRSFYAWEIPSTISLSGYGHGSSDSAMDELEETYNTLLPSEALHHLKKELVIGFYILPRNPSDTSSDFNLVRLISSGKLEFQPYRASTFHCSSKILTIPKPPSSGKEFRVYEDEFWNQDEVVNGNLRFMRFRFLIAYMNNTLLRVVRKAAIDPRRLKVSIHEVKGVECNRDLWELIKSIIPSLARTDDSTTRPVVPLSDIIDDVSFPTSLYELASSQILTSLSPTILYLAFSIYTELFGEVQPSYSFEFLEVIGLMGNRHLPPLMMGKPSSRGEKWSEKTPRGNFLVGPVIPVPILLVLDNLYRDDTIGFQLPDSPSDAYFDEDHDDRTISKVCSRIREELTLLKEEKDCVNLACDVGFSELESKKKKSGFLFYEPKVSASSSSPSLTTTARSFESEIHETFVCGKYQRGGCDDESTDPAADGCCSDMSMFDDLMPIRLEWNSTDVPFSEYEQKIYKKMKGQFLKWQGHFKPYQEFLSEFE